MLTNYGKRLRGLILGLIFYVFPAVAQITFVGDNDLAFGSDKNFSNGVQLSYSTPQADYFILQNIYTPEDIQATDLIPNDRPYSGLLALGADLKKARDKYIIVGRAMLGILGPSAHSEWSQNTVHSLRDIPTAKGWSNERSDKPVFLLGREIRASNYDHDLQIGQSLKFDGGNLFSGIKYGIPFRLGYNLPRFSDRRIKIEGMNDWSFGIEFTPAVQYVAYDGTLKGTDINKEEFYGEYTVGAFLNYKRWGFGLNTVTRTKQWDNDDGDGGKSSFGSISLKF